MIEGFECKLAKVESLSDYFAKEIGPDGECRPCRLEPLASLYLTVLEQAGELAGAKALEEAFDTSDIMVIARTMDGIRAGAKGGVRKELEDLDCLVQSPLDEEDE